MKAQLPCKIVKVSERDFGTAEAPNKRAVIEVTYDETKQFYLDPQDPRVQQYRDAVGKVVSIDVGFGRDGKIRIV